MKTPSTSESSLIDKCIEFTQNHPSRPYVLGLRIALSEYAISDEQKKKLNSLLQGIGEGNAR